MYNNTKTAELIINGDQHTGTALKLINPVLLNTDPSGKTWFFGIIQTPSNKLLKIIDEIISFSGSQEDDHSPKLKNYSSSQLAVESQLEAMLQNINSRLSTHLNEKEIDNIVSHTNIILGLQNENSLSLSGRGEIFAMMIRAKENQDILENKDNYEVINLLRQADDDLLDNDDGLFTHFLSGNLAGGDTLALSTGNLWEKLKEEDLIRGIALLPPHSAVEFIKNNLPKWRGASAASLILKYSPQVIFSSATPSRQQDRRSFKNSIDELVETEEKTEKILSTPTPFKKLAEILSGKKQNKVEEKLHKQPGGNIEKTLRSFFDLFFSLSKALILFLTKVLSQLLSVITNKGQRENTTSEIKNDISLKKEGVVKWFNSLPKKSKIIFVLTVFLIFIFSQSILIFSIKKGYENKKEAYNLLVETIKKSTEEAEASMLYGDDNRAEEFLNGAEQTLSSLSNKSKSEKEQFGFLRELLNEKWARLYHIININEPRLIADLGNTNGESIVEFKGMIFVLSPSSSSILKMNPDSGQVSPFLSFENQDNAPVLWRQSDEDSVIIFKQNYLPSNLEVQLADAQEVSLSSQSIKDIDSSSITERVKDLQIYNNRLYALDTGQNQIWKHSVTSEEFSKGTAWKKDNQIDLRNSLSLTLDGSIYVLNQNGSIEKIFSGEKTDFSAQIPKPIGQSEDFVINNASIWTSDSARFIYILDKTNSRIIVFDKNGKLVAQYISSIFNNIKDFVVKEEEHKIYVLSDTQVYGIIASHINFEQASK